jgi:hypothetical protein
VTDRLSGDGGIKTEFNAREAIIEKFCLLIVGRGRIDAAAKPLISLPKRLGTLFAALALTLSGRKGRQTACQRLLLKGCKPQLLSPKPSPVI